MVRRAAPELVDVAIDDQPVVILRSRAPWAFPALAALTVVGALVALRPAPAPPTPPPDSSPVTAARLSGDVVAPSLDEPWAVTWQVAGDVLGVGSAVLVTTPDGTGVSAIKVDGTRVWGPLAVGQECAPSGQGVVCLSPPGLPPQAIAISAQGYQVAVLLPQGTVDAWWVQDGDVVVVAEQDGFLLAQRWDPIHGPRWTYRSGDAVVAPVGYPFDIEHADSWVRVGGTRSVVLDLISGAEATSVDDVSRATSLSRPTWLRDDSAPGLAVVTDGDDVVVSGVGWFPAPAHLLLDGVLLVGGPDMSAYAMPSGAWLWTAVGNGAFSDGEQVALVEEVAGGALVVARDLHTGEELWKVEAPGACPDLRGVTTEGVVLSGCGTVALVGPALLAPAP